MKKNVLFKSMRHVLPLCMVFLVTGLTSCDNDISEESKKEPLVVSDSLNGRLNSFKSVEEQNAGEKTTEILNRIFDESNPLLNELETQKAYIIKSKEELIQICPDQIEVPCLDFEGSCLVFASIETSSISDEIIDFFFLQKEEKEFFTFKVIIQRCQDCWAANGKMFPYGFYDMASDSIKNIVLEVEEKNSLQNYAARLVESEVVTSFFNMELPNGDEILHYFFPSPSLSYIQRDTCFMINNRSEFKEIYSGEIELPEINFEENTLLIGMVMEPAGYSLENKVVCITDDSIVVMITKKEMEGAFISAIVPYYFWGLYEKLPQKKIVIKK